MGSDQPAMAVPCLQNLLTHEQICAYKYQTHDII